MFYIRKTSGEKQRFDLLKFRRSLFKAGASEKEIQSIIRTIKKEKPRSTNRIHEIATELLEKKNPPVADRYNLKRGLMDLGPDGYSFEQFIAQLIEQMGYKTQTNRVIPGACVDHEVDVIATKKGHRCMVECKFHNRVGLKSDVKVTLYVQARFEDIQDQWQRHKSKEGEIQAVWLVTNTQFTSEAIKYGKCKGFRLIGWGYPKQDNLAQLIEKYSLFPITILTSLSKLQKKKLLQNGLVLCKDARKHEKTLAHLGFTVNEIRKLVTNAEAVCKI